MKYHQVTSSARSYRFIVILLSLVIGFVRSVVCLCVLGTVSRAKTAEPIDRLLVGMQCVRWSSEQPMQYKTDSIMMDAYDKANIRQISFLYVQSFAIIMQIPQTQLLANNSCYTDKCASVTAQNSQNVLLLLLLLLRMRACTSLNVYTTTRKLL